jgi:hypothetical protein
VTDFYLSGKSVKKPNISPSEGIRETSAENVKSDAAFDVVATQHSVQKREGSPLIPHHVLREAFTWQRFVK